LLGFDIVVNFCGIFYSVI